MGESAFARSVGCSSCPGMMGAQSPICAFCLMTIWLHAAEIIDPAEYAWGLTHAVVLMLCLFLSGPLMYLVSCSVVYTSPPGVSMLRTIWVAPWSIAFWQSFCMSLSVRLSMGPVSGMIAAMFLFCCLFLFCCALAMLMERDRRRARARRIVWVFIFFVFML